MNFFSISSAVILMLVSQVALASSVWTPPLTKWEVDMDNGVAYIQSNLPSDNFPANCSGSRGAIKIIGGTDFDKAMFSYALSAKAKGAKIKVVVDNAVTNCIISGILEVE